MRLSDAAAQVAKELDAKRAWNYDTIECVVYDALSEAFDRLAALTKENADA